MLKKYRCSECNWMNDHGEDCSQLILCMVCYKEKYPGGKSHSNEYCTMKNEKFKKYPHRPHCDEDCPLVGRNYMGCSTCISEGRKYCIYHEP